MSEHTVVLTRDTLGNAAWKSAFEEVGIATCSLPCIGIEYIEDPQGLDPADSYDVIIFTSANGVRAWIRIFDSSVSPLVAVVGQETYKAAREAGFTIYYAPTVSNAAALAEGLPNPAGKRVLAVGPVDSDPSLATVLQRRGAAVDQIALYKTLPYNSPDAAFEKRLMGHESLCLTFASPSAVVGFTQKLSPAALRVAQQLPAVSIGATTEAKLAEAGFTNRHTAEAPDADHMIGTITSLFS